MTHHRTAPAGALAALAVAAAAAHAQTDFTADERRISVTHDYWSVNCTGSGEIFTEEDTRTPASSFALFSDTLSLPYTDLATTTVSQTSSFTGDTSPGTVSGSGLARIDTLALAPGCAFLESRAVSSLRWRMDLPATTLVEISIANATTGDADVRFTVSTSPGFLINEALDGDTYTAVIPVPPGDRAWAVSAIADTVGTAGTHAASFDAAITLHGQTCNPADLALPAGVLDLADLQAFVAYFLDAQPYADFADPAGTLDLADLNVFISAFAAGCP